jgi:hypothetical protein
MSAAFRRYCSLLIKNLVSVRNSFHGGGNDGCELFFEPRFLHHCGAEMVLLFPLRYSTNEIHQQARTLLFEAVLGKDHPPPDVYK